MSHHHPTWSPDGKKIAFDSGFYIWVVDADGSNLTQLTPHHGAYPAWSPDGSKIAYSHHEGTKGSDIWVMNSDGSSQRSLTDSSENDEFPGWSPDGKRIAYGRGNWPNWNESNIWVVDLSGNAVQLTSNPALEADPDWAYQPDANDTVKPLAPDLEKAILAGADSENVEISWYRSADELEPGGTIRYEIWRSQSLAGTYTRLGEVPAYGSSLYSYLDAGAGNGDSNDYFYKVHSVDISGNRNESAQISGKFTRALEMGPNLISIPLVQWDEKIEVVLQTPSWNKAWIYDASIGKWKWHMKFKPYLGELREINHELGVWINITEPSNLTVAGIVPIATNILLRDGWNLVAFPSFNSSYSVSDLKVAAPVKRIESFDSSAPPYSLRVLTDVDYLQSGAGYWIKAGVQTVWIVGNS